MSESAKENPQKTEQLTPNYNYTQILDLHETQTYSPTVQITYPI